MSFTPADLDELERLSREATKPPWERDSRNAHSSEEAYGVILGPSGDILFDTLNSECAVIHRESDEDGVYYWDEPGRVNSILISTLRNRCDDMAAELRRAWEAEAAMRKALCDIEWLNFPDSDIHENCPSCGMDKNSGHRSACELAAALAHTGNPLTTEVERLKAEVARLASLVNDGTKAALAGLEQTTKWRKVRRLGMNATISRPKSPDKRT